MSNKIEAAAGLRQTADTQISAIQANKDLTATGKFAPGNKIGNRFSKGESGNLTRAAHFEKI